MTEICSPTLKRYLFNAKKNGKVVLAVMEADTQYLNGRAVQSYIDAPEILKGTSEDMAIEFMRGYILATGGVITADRLMADFRKALDYEIPRLANMVGKMAEYYNGLEERKAFSKELNRRDNNKPKVNE